MALTHHVEVHDLDPIGIVVLVNDTFEDFIDRYLTLLVAVATPRIAYAALKLFFMRLCRI